MELSLLWILALSLGFSYLASVAGLSCYKCTYINDIITAGDPKGRLREIVTNHVNKVNDINCKKTGADYTLKGYKVTQCSAKAGQAAACVSGNMRVTRSFSHLPVGGASASFQLRLRQCVLLPAEVKPTQGCRQFDISKTLDKNVLAYLNKTQRYELSGDFLMDGKYCLCLSDDCNDGLDATYTGRAAWSPAPSGWIAALLLLCSHMLN